MNRKINTNKAFACLACLAFLLLPFVAFNQEITVPEPEFINTAVFVENNQPLRLEKAIPYDVDRRTIGSWVTGIHASELLKNVNGTNSHVRLPQQDTYNFIIRVASNEYDPFGAISIIKMKETRSNRVYKLMGTDMLGQTKSGDLEYIPFDGRKYGESSYHIQVSQNMEPGEYAIVLRYATDVVNCFGVGEIGYIDDTQTNSAAGTNNFNNQQQRTQYSRNTSGSGSNGYDNFTKGRVFPYINTGLSWANSLPIVVGLDYMITDKISLGAEYTRYSWNDSYYDSFIEYDFTWIFQSIGVRGAYHLAEEFDLADPNFDLYTGIYVGTVSLTGQDNTDGDTEDFGSSPPGWAVFGGARYLLSDRVALMGELSYGLVYIKAGLSFKL